MSTRGQTTIGILVSAGTALAIALGGYSMSLIDKVDDKTIDVAYVNTLQGERITATETEILNIKATLVRMENKLDLIMAKQGVVYIQPIQK
jgi:hypothetical protein